MCGKEDKECEICKAFDFRVIGCSLTDGRNRAYLFGPEMKYCPECGRKVNANG